MGNTLQQIREYIWLFIKRWYFFVILLLDDPWGLAERWGGMNYTPPPYLFWILLSMAIILALGAAYFDLRNLRSRKLVDKLILDKKTDIILGITDTLKNISDYYSSIIENKTKERIDKRQFIQLFRNTLGISKVTIYPYRNHKSYKENLNEQVKRNVKKLGLSNPLSKNFNDEDIQFMNNLFNGTSDSPFGIQSLINNDENKSKYNGLIQKLGWQISNVSVMLGAEIYKYRDAALGINNLYVLYINSPPSLKKQFFIENRFNYTEFADSRDRCLSAKLRTIRELLEKELRIGR
jgi:hypothetical protein